MMFWERVIWRKFGGGGERQAATPSMTEGISEGLGLREEIFERSSLGKIESDAGWILGKEMILVLRSETDLETDA